MTKTPPPAHSRPAALPPIGTFPSVVDHKFGTTTVPAAPERVVSVGLTEQDTLLQLGVSPVAVTEWYGEQSHATWPWATALLDDAEPEVLSASDGFEFEKIAALEPDLIIGVNAGMTESDYELLSAIAPTVTSVKAPPSTSPTGRTRPCRSPGRWVVRTAARSSSTT